MVRKLAGTVVVLLVLGIVVLIVRDNVSFDDWTTEEDDASDPSGVSGAGA